MSSQTTLGLKLIIRLYWSLLIKTVDIAFVAKNIALIVLGFDEMRERIKEIYNKSFANGYSVDGHFNTHNFTYRYKRGYTVNRMLKLGR